MAYGVIAFANTNMYRARKVLEEVYQDRKCPTITEIKIGSTYSNLKGIVFVPTIQEFIRQKHVLDSSKCLVFLFGPAVVLEYLDPVDIVDLQSKPNSFTYRFKPLTAHDLKLSIDNYIEDKTHKNVTVDSINVIPTLLHEQPSSLMAPILNYLYSMPNTNERLRVQSIIYAWLCSTNTDTEQLKEELLKHKKKKSVSNPLKELLEYFDSENGTNYKLALQEVSKQKKDKGTYNVPKIAKQFKVSEYDISYTMKSINKIRRSSTILHSEPLSKQFWDRKNDPSKKRTKDKERDLRIFIKNYKTTTGNNPTLSLILEQMSLTKEEVFTYLDNINKATNNHTIINDLD